MKTAWIRVLLVVWISAAVCVCSLAQMTPKLEPASSYEDACQKAIKFHNSCLWEEAEHYLRECLRFGTPDRGAEVWVWQRMSVVVGKLGRSDEATSIAQRLWQMERTPENWACLVEAAVSGGDYPLARARIREAQSFESQWGNAAKWLKDLRTSMSSRVYRCTWFVPPERFEGREILPIALPTSDSPVQKVLKYRVEGAKSWTEKADEIGNKYLAVVPNPGQEVRLVAEIKMIPYSYKKDLHKYKPGPLPEDVKVWLGKCVPPQWKWGGNGEPWAVIDPESALARSIAGKLKGKTPVQTAENIQRWVHVNLSNTSESLGLRNAESSDTILSKGGGHCAHVTGATVALMRAAGIPARGIRGCPGVTGKSGKFIQHSLVEFYINGIGWIDLQLGEYAWAPILNFVRQYREIYPKPLSVYLPFIQRVETLGPNHKYEPIHTYELISESLD